MLAVIPARGGSKGVPGKNIKELSGKPLIVYTIEAALDSNIFEKVIVSTDSEEIAGIAKQSGAEVPFIRPDELSGDMIPSDDVIIHTLDFYKKQGIEFDNVCKLQPTSPFRNSQHLKDSYNLFCEKNVDFLVSVCECEHSPMWAGTIEKDLKLDNFIQEDMKKACRQSLPVYYRLNGAIYIGKVKAFEQNKSFLGRNSIAYIMPQEASIDIDTSLDFEYAEFFMKKMNRNI
ncbi:MAG: pseudaminic acid cytidylyltransferase [Lachnospiraceae bacterium]|nr:pseudaminic acid cytidylyltransferase [Lachnospiraceae bacterium]